MSIPSLYGVTGSSPSPSGLSIVASGQTEGETVVQLTEMNRILKSDLSIYKGMAAFGLVMSASAGVYILWQKMLEKRVSSAQEAQQQAQQAQRVPQYPVPYAPPPAPYGYPPYGYR